MRDDVGEKEEKIERTLPINLAARVLKLNSSSRGIEGRAAIFRMTFPILETWVERGKGSREEVSVTESREKTSREGKT